MAKFQALPTLIAIVIYYVALFISVTVLTNGSISVNGVDLGGAATMDGNNFMLNSSFNSQTNPFTMTEHCGGTGTSMNFIGGMLCEFAHVSDNDSCASIQGCTPMTPGFFNNASCTGYVNKTYYNITPELSYDTKYCLASGLQSRGICIALGCSWLSPNDQFNTQIDYQSKFQTVSIWQTIGWIITFRYDFGFEPFFNVIINFILAVLIPLIIAALIYFMFVPF